LKNSAPGPAAAPPPDFFRFSTPILRGCTSRAGDGRAERCGERVVARRMTDRTSRFEYREKSAHDRQDFPMSN
jgi:hypothetical protein